MGGPEPAIDLSDEQLLRYSRHILLPEIGIEGQQKVESARETLARINPEVRVEAIASRVGGRLDELVNEADVVLDGTDNFATRHAINRACVRYRKPLVSGA